MSSSSPPSIYVTTAGCVEHQSVAERVRVALASTGYEMQGDGDDAQVCVIIACHATDALLAASIDAIVDLTDVDDTSKTRKLIVAGGLIAGYHNDLADALPEVDAWIPEDDPARIVQAIDAYVAAVFPKTASQSVLTAPARTDLFVRGGTAYVSVVCCGKGHSIHRFPSYPHRFHPRPVEEVEQEIRTLLAIGVSDIVLLGDGQNGLREGESEHAYLRTLVTRLVAMDGLRWLRFHGWATKTWLSTLLPLMRQWECIVPYIDLPVWPLSSDVLGEQGKRDALAQLRAFRAWEGATLRATVMAGVPERSVLAFEKLCESIHDYPFDHLDIWMVGCEEDAAERGIDWQQMDMRYTRLIEAQGKIARSLLEKQIGNTLEVLVDGQSVEHPWVWEAHHMGQMPGVDGAVFLSFETTGYVVQPGERLLVEIEDASGKDLVGNVIDRVKP